MAGHHQDVVERLARALPARGRCLDVGCGAGGVPVALASWRRDCVVVGVDPSASAIARGRRRARGLARVHLLRAGAERIPLPSAGFHGACATGVIKHCGDPIRAMAEIRRVVRPGGWLWLYELDPAAVASGPERFAGLVTESPDVAARLLRRFVLPRSLAREHVRALAEAAGWGIDADAAMPSLPLYALHLRRRA